VRHDMRRVRIVGFCVMVVFVLGAFAMASGASAAAPEFRVCAKLKKSKTTKKYEGKYNNKTCSEVNAKGEGKYELEGWEAAKKKALKGKGGAGTLDAYLASNESEPWTGGLVLGTVTCKSAKVTGEITGAKTATASVEFKTCTSEGKKCKSAGAKTGVIDTEKLYVTLGYIESGKGVGTLVEGGAGGADLSAKFNCEGLEFEATGSVIGVDSGNVNSVSKSFTLKFAVNAKGGQEVTTGEFPNGITGAQHYLDTFVQPTDLHLPSGEDATVVLKSEAAEVYAPGA
jgi:hypothetical protein